MDRHLQNMPIWVFFVTSVPPKWLVARRQPKVTKIQNVAEISNYYRTKLLKKVLIKNVHLYNYGCTSVEIFEFGRGWLHWKQYPAL